MIINEADDIKPRNRYNLLKWFVCDESQDWAWQIFHHCKHEIKVFSRFTFDSRYAPDSTKHSRYLDILTKLSLWGPKSNINSDSRIPSWTPRKKNLRPMADGLMSPAYSGDGKERTAIAESYDSSEETGQRRQIIHIRTTKR